MDVSEVEIPCRWHSSAVGVFMEDFRDFIAIIRVGEFAEDDGGNPAKDSRQPQLPQHPVNGMGRCVHILQD